MRIRHLSLPAVLPGVVFSLTAHRVSRYHNAPTVVRVQPFGGVPTAWVMEDESLPTVTGRFVIVRDEQAIPDEPPGGGSWCYLGSWSADGGDGPALKHLFGFLPPFASLTD
jgi:hypothetical protein